MRPALESESNSCCNKQFWMDLGAIVGVGVVVLLWNLGNTQLWDQDEGYYAATAAEMFERSDPIVPTFNGSMFGHKPPMMFWGMMLGYQMLGVTELGARLVSALFGIGTAWVTYRIGCRLFDRATGLYGALALCSSLMFSMVARSATADAHLSFFVTLSFSIWLRDVFPAGMSPSKGLGTVRRSTWMLSYATMGLAVLTKGPIGLLFPMAVIGLFLLTQIPRGTDAKSNRWMRAWRVVEPYSPIPFARTVWQMRPITAIVMVLLVAGPWYAIVQWQTHGAFLNEFIGVHHLGRFSNAMDNHRGPIIYYLVACLIGMYPWSAFAIPAAIEWWRDIRSDRFSKAAIFVACWIAVYLILFSLAKTKLPNYVLPAYPALALLLGRYVALWSGTLRTVSRRWTIASWGLMGSVGLTFIIGFPAAGLIFANGESILDRLRIDRAIHGPLMWLGVVGIPLVIGGVVGVWLSVKGRERWLPINCVVAASVMLVVVWQYGAPQMDRFQAHQGIATLVRKVASETNAGGLDHPPNLAVVGYFRPTMVFYYRQPILFCDSTAQALEQMESCPNSYLVTTDAIYQDLRPSLPDELEVLYRATQFPRKGELVLLGNQRLIR